MFNLWWILFNFAKIYDPDRKYGDCNILDGNLCFINVHHEHKWVLMTSQTEKYNDQDFLKNINTWSMWCDALLHPEFLTPSLCVSSLSKKAPHQHFSLHKNVHFPHKIYVKDRILIHRSCSYYFLLLLLFGNSPRGYFMLKYISRLPR